jgi:hypothetical protein
VEVESDLRVDVGESGVHVHREFVFEDYSSRHHGQKRTLGCHSGTKPFIEWILNFVGSEDSRGIFRIDVDVTPVSFD